MFEQTLDSFILIKVLIVAHPNKSFIKIWSPTLNSLEKKKV